MFSQLIAASLQGVFDYNLLIDCLKDYKAPHRKITTFLQTKKIIRIKKGLYILGGEYRQNLVSREYLANLIFGPSYISQEYALQYYGLIPERVETLTSMTTKRHKIFDTPLGRFTYTYLNSERFSVGVDKVELQNNISILIASPEKALCDLLIKYNDIKTVDDMSVYLIENIRVEEDSLRRLNKLRMEKIVSSYHSPVVSLFYKTLLRKF
ncbi:MAG: hypothetical protein A3F17_00910 [Gammaproteobacteria bacterium RIFCSPHIGHO2_12_FULL_41_15]|nr:MAG: hypothetical protein A3F17_00910 [Gammaproteobacteria bacterium RIFCSPHIGHO2_12_FULL_41_15]